MSKLVNTSQEEVNPQWLLGGNPGAIEAQESHGQSQFIADTKLPVEIHGKEELEKLGFEFGEPLPNDPLFCEGKLPEGWSKRATDHSMRSEIVDTEGTVRATVFYKAAFYDRRATLYIEKN